MSAAASTRDVIRFGLNGHLCEVRGVDPNLTLLGFLRTHKRLTGTKEGCAEGDCGACTVAVTDVHQGSVRVRPVNACIHLMPMVDGKDVRTVEGLASPNGRLHPVQQALVDEHGSQCGFCTPGFVMSLYVLYQQGGPATVRDVDRALAGNLCRCTGYGPIIRAALQMGRRSTHTEETQSSDARLAGLELLHSELPLRLDYECPVSGTRRRYFAPRTLDELTGALAEAPRATVLAGGTDLALRITKRFAPIDDLISLQAVPELDEIVEHADRFEIGAAACYHDVQTAIAGVYPELATFLDRLGGAQVRSVGTIGGNIANGSPIGDGMPPLVAAGATLTLRKGTTERTIRLEDFFIAYGKQDRRPGEIVTRVTLPKPGPERTLQVYKVSKRFDQDISTVCAAFGIEWCGGIVRDARICFGGMAGTPKRAAQCERALIGKPFDRTSVARAQEALASDFQPLTDLRGSAGYRMTVAKNLLFKAFLERTDPGSTAPLDRY